ncbi:MAG: creatininase family protein [Pseudomonadota bacterium]
MPSRYWQNLTTEDFAELDREHAIALLPVGAVEQHGPHLPLSTDSAIASGLIARCLEVLPDELSVLVLPLQSVGASGEHGAFAGTLSQSPETLIAAWCELGRWVARAGLRKLVIFNSHGGQPQIVDMVAQRLRIEQAMLVTKVSSFQLGVPEGLIPEDELRHGIHGGAFETSLMLHLHPALVRRDKLADFRSLSEHMAGDYKWLGPHGPAGFAWMAQDLNRAGACGNAASADAETGRRLLDHMAGALAEILAEVARFPLATFDPAP